MLAIGRGLMSKPKLQMFDEPSLGLSPILVKDIFNVIKKIKEEGTTVLIVEQNVKQTLAIADRAYVLENGKIALQGTGEDCSTMNMSVQPTLVFRRVRHGLLQGIAAEEGRSRIDPPLI